MTATLDIIASDFNWRTRSACGGTADLHFADVDELIDGGLDRSAAAAEVREATEAAKAICAGCPVIGQCRDEAFANDEEFGVWGGLDPFERHTSRADWLAVRDVVGLALPLTVIKDQDALSADPAANAKLLRRNDKARRIRDALLLLPTDWTTQSRDLGKKTRDELLTMCDAVLASPSWTAEQIAERLGKSNKWLSKNLRAAGLALGID